MIRPPFKYPLVEKTGHISKPWLDYFESVNTKTIFNENRFDGEINSTLFHSLESIQKGFDGNQAVMFLQMIDTLQKSFETNQSLYAKIEELEKAVYLTDFIATAQPVFGGIYAYEANSTITITVAGIANKVQVTAFDTNGESSLTVPDHTNDHITVSKNGVYRVTCVVNINSVAGPAATFGIIVSKNNGATNLTNLHGHADMAGGGGELKTVSMHGQNRLSAGDTIEVWVWNYTGTENLIVDDVNLNIEKIGE